jgi:hypothetical protein
MKSKSFLTKSYQKSHRLIRQSTANMRILPHFIIFGVARGGTTSLYNYLTAHPSIASATAKEILFFDHRYHLGLKWYKAHFPSWISKYGKKHLITGEASPSYLYHPSVPQRIKETLPAIKLIILLRNPVDRAYSHYLMKLKTQQETLPYEIAVKHQMIERELFEKEGILENDAHFQRIYHPHAYLSKGIYLVHLQRWFNTFKKQQILILQSEEFYSNPEIVLQNTLEFLELPKWTLNQYEKHNADGQHFANPSSKNLLKGKNHEQMDLSLRQQLVDYFRPYNEQLYEFLGRDFGWEQ